MSRHESVSCDACMRANFKGKRYKCLICYDYDLCSTCFEAGATTTRHSSEHPMQCIITRADFDLYFGGDGMAIDQPQSYTCPYCGKMGFTENTLQDHASSEHTDLNTEIICPVCASMSGGDPNHVTDDFIGHLSSEHRWRDVHDEPTGALRSHRRMPNSRGRGGHRARHFTPSSTTSSNPVPRESSMDPIAELLSHLSGVHSRVRGTPQQLRELQMQIDAERALRDHLQQRLPGHRAFEPSTQRSQTSSNNSETVLKGISTAATASSSSGVPKSALDSCVEPVQESAEEVERREEENADHSLFVQEFLMSTLSERLQIDDGGSSSEDSDEIHQSALDLLTTTAMTNSSENKSADQLGTEGNSDKNSLTN